MTVINRAAAGVDPTAGRFTVYVPPSGNIRAPKYVVYDTLAEAQADVNAHKFGAVYPGGGALTVAYQYPTMSTFRPAPGTPPVVIGPANPQLAPQVAAARAAVAQPIPVQVPRPPPPQAVPPAAAAAPASTWAWVSAPVPAATNPGTATAGSLRLGAVASGPHGADVQITVVSMRPSDTVKFSIGAQVNNNWAALYNIATPTPLTPGWKTVTLHLNYDEVNAYLHTVNPNLSLKAGMQVAIGATFSTGHNTGMPGWTSRNGSEQDIFVTLPPPA